VQCAQKRVVVKGIVSRRISGNNKIGIHRIRDDFVTNEPRVARLSQFTITSLPMTPREPMWA
jgi:hypothetical protein